jgi:hypothetical protein
MWARLIFMLPTRRPIRIAPGLWLQVPWAMSDRELADTLRAAVRRYELRKRLSQAVMSREMR